MKLATRNKLLVSVVVIVIIAATVGVVALVHFGSNKTSLSDSSFTVHYPTDWRSVAPSSVPGASQDLAVLKQRSGLGLVAFAREGSASTLNAAFITNLNSQLKQSTPDYKVVGWKIIKVGPSGTQALLFTYLRTKKAEVHTVTVVPAGDHTFVIATAASESDPTISKEVGQIITSFTLKS